MTSVQDAYAKLGLQEGCTLEEVRSSYKKLALATHPDKDKSEGATQRFQELSSAFKRLEMHFERRNGSTWHEYDSDDNYHDEEEDLQSFFYIFEEVMRGRFRVFHFSGRRGDQGAQFVNLRTHSPGETEEQYQERLHRAYEDRKAAERQRKKADIERRERKEREREKERIDAEQRREEKAARKKADDEAARINREHTIQSQKQRSQALRSSVFAAARENDTERVKKGIWEDGVEADGGEIRPGCESFVKTTPKDPSETLLHIAASLNNLELVEYLDKRVPEAERNSSGMTAFHVAVCKGCVPIVKYFIQTYDPIDESYDEIYKYSSESLLRLAIRSGEPEILWIILENNMASQSEINDAWSWFSSTNGQSVIKQAKPQSSNQCLEEICNLLLAYGGFTPPSSPQIASKKLETAPQIKVDTHTAVNEGGDKRRGRPIRSPTSRPVTSPVSVSPRTGFSGKDTARGGGRGKRRGRGGGRGRGVAPA